MRLGLSCFFFLSVFNIFSQESVTPKDTLAVKIDSLYREDQFYVGVTYNSLINKPSGLSQGRISTGFSLGFLRDMPVNKSRTIAIAPGIGLAYNNYNQNLAITSTNQGQVYTIVDSDANYNKNRFEQLFVEVPVEFRWRSSTPESTKFWRVYGGFKFSYLVFDKSVYVDDQVKSTITNNKDFNKMLYGAYISTGYNTVNVYFYYGLNSLFKSAKIDNEPIKMSSMNIGVMFYIL